MIPIAGKPILEYIIKDLANYGFDEICIVVGHHANKIKNYFGNGFNMNLKIQYVTQLEYNGTADALKLAKKFAEDGHIAVRNVRRDINNQIKQIQKKDDISVDNAHDGLNKIQEMTDEHIRKIDELIELKEKDIMEI